MQSYRSDDQLTSINIINLTDTMSDDDHMILHIPTWLQHVFYHCHAGEYHQRCAGFQAGGRSDKLHA